MKNGKFYRGFITTLICFISFNRVFGQDIIYSEDFNGGNNSFNLNTGGAASNTGVNTWIVDSAYNGNGVYPNTPNESQTSGGGGISGAPRSQYLHIHDSNSPAGALNANYDTALASDNFAEMGGDICTLGYDSVHFVFYYIAEGNTSDYGQLYYSLDGGFNWLPLSTPGILNNTSSWKYVIVANPVFANQSTLRFGFQWTNTGASPPKDVSIGIDDIFVVGYQNPLHLSALSISDVSPSTICLGGNALVTVKLSKPLCDGNYNIALSDPSGNFNGGAISFSVFMATGDSTASFFLNFPSILAQGTCYKLNVSRTSFPFLTGNTTACFSLINCNDSIQTIQPVVLHGPDTACTRSVIDVPFWSYGEYYSGNNYIAQISDAGGSFANPGIIGSSLDSSSYDPSMGSSPGIVSGIIPNVPPGCNYYIRVVATDPSVVPGPSDYYGPFCLKQCDVLTNNASDIHLCITSTSGDDTTISLKINQWNNNAKYAAGDSFLVQILNSKNDSVLNTGAFGKVVTNVDTTLKLTVPNLQQVIALLDTPGTGEYYLRLVALHSSTQWNTTGTLIRLVVGSFSQPGTLDVSDTLLCMKAGGAVYFTVHTPDKASRYQWEIDPRIKLNGFPVGQAFYSPYPPAYEFAIGFPPDSLAVGDYWFLAREVNNGCISPWFDSAHVRIIPTPSVAITGPDIVCVGDTVTYHVSYMADTYYSWTAASKGVRQIDTSNNEFTLIFDSAGVVSVRVIAINQCGQASGSKTVTVKKDCHNCSGYFVLRADSTTPHHWFAIPYANGKMPITYNWQWGDGTSGTGDTASHTYAQPGYYDICMTITDDSACTSTYCDSSTYLYRREQDNSMVYVNIVNSLVAGTITLNSNSPLSKLFVLPNPCNTCKVKGLDNVNDIVVTDVLGRKIGVIFTKASGDYTIGFQSNQTGMFLLHNLKTGQVVKFVRE